jgi:hypothetical protein
MMVWSPIGAEELDPAKQEDRAEDRVPNPVGRRRARLAGRTKWAKLAGNFCSQIPKEFFDRKSPLKNYYGNPCGKYFQKMYYY